MRPSRVLPLLFLLAGFCPPARAGVNFLSYSPVDISSFTVNWTSTFAPGTLYYVDLSTGALPNAFTGNASSNTLNLFAGFTGLTPATVYYSRVSTDPATGPYGDLLSTPTLAAVPGPPQSGSTFTAVTANALTVNWSSGTNAQGYNPAGTTFGLQISSTSGFNKIQAFVGTTSTTTTGNTFADNTTFYFRVAAQNQNQFISAFEFLGSTMTPVATPTAIAFDEILAATITASAYASNGAFVNLDQGQSGTNEAVGGVYAGWHGGYAWATLAPMPTARYGVAAAAVNGKIYVIGGTDGTNNLAVNERYDPATNSWAAMAPMPTARADAAAAVYNGKIYVVGGVTTGGVTGVAEMYDPAADAWTARKSMPTARESLAAVAAGGIIYAIGGQNPGPLATTEGYDPLADAWTTRAAMPAARFGLGAVYQPAAGFIYAAGGNDGSNPLLTMKQYDPVNNVWSADRDLRVARYFVMEGAVGGKIFVAGGDSGSVQDVDEEYDPFNDNWTSRPPMPTPRRGGGAVAVGGRLFVLGGQDGSGPLSANERYDPGVATVFNGLTPNTVYSFKAQARDSLGRVTAETTVFSTRTAAAPPGPPVAASSFTNIAAGGLTLQWASGSAGVGFNPAGTRYLAQLSLSPTFIPVAASSQTLNLTADFAGLTANATYYAQAAGLNNSGDLSDFTDFGSTLTPPVPPAAPVGVASFTSVGATALTLNWSSGTPAAYDSAGTSYLAEISTMAAFVPLWDSSQTFNLAAIFGGLSFGTTYYARVEAIGSTGTATGFVDFGSTVTGTGVVFAGFPGVGASSLTVAWTSGFSPGLLYYAYASTGPFPNSFSGNLSSNTYNLFAGFSGLAPTTTYYAQVSTSAASGPYYALASTFTWATPPTAPIGLSTFSAVSASALTVRWSSGSAAAGFDQPGTSYFVQLSTFPDFSLIAASSRTFNLSASLSGLTPNSLYWTEIQAINSQNIPTGFANFGSTLTLAAPPGAPVGISSVSLITATNMTFFWSSGTAAGGFNVDGTSYTIRLATTATFSPVSVSSTTPVLSTTFGGLVSNRVYFFDIDAINAAGTPTAFVFFGSTATLAALPGPSVSTYTTVYSSGMTVNWNADGNDAGTTYYVQVSTMADFIPVAASSAPNILSASFTGLSPNVTYYTQVAAYDITSATWTAFATPGSLVTPAAAPGPPGGFSTFAAVGYSSFTVNWSSGSPAGGYSPPGTSYLCRISTMPGFVPILLSSATQNLTASFTGAPILGNTTYYAQVQAVNAAGAGTPFTGLGSAFTPPQQPFVAATPVTAVSATALTISWGADFDPPRTIYDAQISTAVSFAPVAASSSTLNLNAGFAGLQPNTTYYGQAAAYNVAAGTWTAFAAVASTSTLAVVPGPAVSTFTSVFVSSLTVHWSSGTAAGGYDPPGTVYLVQLATAASFTTVTASSQTVNLFAVFAGLDSGGTYYAEIMAVNNNGVPTAFSNAGSTRTFGGAIAVGGFSAVTASSLTVSWTSSYPPGTTYYTQLSSGAFPNAFTGNGSSNTLNLSADFSGLSPNATYYAETSTAAAGPFTALGQTMTPAAAPGAAVSTYTAVTVGGLTVNWSSGAAGSFDPPGTLYLARLSTSATFAPVLLSSQTFNLNAAFSGLTGAVTYYAEVEAFNGQGTATGFVDFGSTTTATGPPAASTPAFSAVSSAALTAAWSSNSPAGTPFYAQISTAAGFGSVYFSSQTLNTAAVFGALTANTTYFVRAAGYDVASATWTAFAALGSTSTLAAAPGAAASTFTAETGTAFTLNWSANGNPAGTLFIAQISAAPGFSPPAASSQTYNAAAAFSGLSANGTYYAQVAAVNNNGLATAFTDLTSTVTAVAAPAGPVAVATFTNIGPSGLTVNWSSGTPAAGYDAAGTRYVVEISTMAGFAPLWASSQTANLSVVFTALSFNTTYYAHVQALAASGAATAFTDLGSTPTLIGISPGGFTTVDVGSVTASWTTSFAPGTLYYAQASTGPFPNALAGNVSSNTLNLFATFAGLSVNVTYYVQAATAVAGPYYDLGSTTTLAAPPSAAGAPFAAVSAGGLTANWASGGNPGGTRYEAQASTSAAFSTLAASSQTYNLAAAFAGLVPNTTYYAQVRAFNGQNLPTVFAAIGSTMTVATAPSPPAGTATFTAVSGGGLTLNWSSGTPAAYNPLGVTAYEAQLSTSPAFSPLASSSQTYNLFAAFAGLNPNVVYYAQVRAMGGDGVATAFTGLGSTATTTAAPASAASTFTAVTVSGLTVNWGSGGNPPGTTYYAQLSPSPGFVPIIASSRTFNLSAAFAGLGPNASYYAQVAAYSINTATWTVFSGVGSTSTLADPPAAPALVDVESSSIAFSWSAGGNPAGTTYYAEVSTDSFATLDASTRVLALNTTFFGLAANATYYLRAAAVNNDGLVTAFSALPATWTAVAAPLSAAPSAVGTSSITANWGAGGNAPTTLYLAQISTDGFLTVNAASATLDTFAIFSGLAANTTYYFRALAVGNGGLATAFTALPPAQTALLTPGAAGAPFSGVATTSLSVNWTSGGNGAGTTYYAEISTDNFASVDASSTTLNLTAAFSSLTPNTTFFGRVEAVSGGNASAYLTLGSTATAAVAPGSIAGSTFSAVTGNAITLNWSSGTAGAYNPAATEYDAQLSTSASFAPTAASSRTFNLFAAFSGLNPNTVYYARARAVNVAGTPTGYVNFGSTATPTAVPGAAAAPFTAVAAAGLTVNWTASGNAPGTTYYAQLSPSPGFVPVVASSVTCNLAAAFSGLTPNTSYYAQVAAYNVNTTTWTAFLSVGSTSTLANPPTSPALVEVDFSSIAFTWSAGGDPAGTTYYAEVSTDNFATLDASTQTLAVDATFYNLTANATYFLRVAAVNNNGLSSAYAALASTWTAAAAPAAAAPASVGTSSITVFWSSGGNAATTPYLAQISTDAFATINASALAAALSGAFTGLSANTTYYFRVAAIGNDGQATAFTALSPAMTALLTPGAAASGFAAVSAGGLTVQWTSGGNGAGTTYYAEISTDAFATVNAASTTLNLAATFAGLTPNTSYYGRVEAVSGGNTSAFLVLGSTINPALPPAGTAVTGVTAASATINWGLNTNPAATIAEVSQSTDGVAYLPVFTGAAVSVVDGNLLGCATYWVKVRNRGGSGEYTVFDSSVQFVTQASTPLPAIGMTAAAAAGNKVFLSWTGSPSPGIVQYDLFYDNGSGTIGYGAPLASFSAAQSSYTTGVLVSSASYAFALRAKNRCGIEETTGSFAAAASTATLSPVSAVIRTPDSGKRVAGNAVSVVAELSSGAPDRVARVAFQYRPAGTSNWLDVVSANPNHPNPAVASPYYIHWDVNAAPGAGTYDLRALAVDVDGSTDTAPSSITIVVDPATPDITENLVGGQVQKSQTVNDGAANTMEVAGWGANDPVAKILLPAGALNASTVTFTMTGNPAITTGPPAGMSLAGSALRVNLSNGQSLLSAGLTAGLTLSYPASAGAAQKLQIFVLNEATGQWTKDFDSTVDAARQTVTGYTPHFSLFAVVAGGAVANDLLGVRVYPNPYKPDGGNPDEGKPFSSGDPTSGVVFDKLPATAEIKIYTISGQLVASMSSQATAGTIHWDARNNSGRDVASGMYFAVISSQGLKTVVKKVAILR